MILQGVSATLVPDNASYSERAVASFLAFIERRMGVSVIRKSNGVTNHASLQEPLRLATLLRERGVIEHFGRSPIFSDEPPVKSWYAVLNESTSHQVGGSTMGNDAAALYATLAEALERYVWYTQTDYFLKPTTATVADISRKGAYIAPEDFAGYSDEQRASKQERQLREDAEYLWIQGNSLTRGGRVYLPAQIVSGVRHAAWRQSGTEPMIRQHTTNGLATWTTQVGAQLRGALEVIERDAYITTWLNQITPPRIALTPLYDRDATLAKNVAKCEQYRLKVHAVQLITDAPTHAVMVIIEDTSGIAPRFSVGLKAHRSLTESVQKAMAEALRARRGYRLWAATGNTWDETTPVENIGHRERLHYWGVPKHAQKLSFLIEGAETEVEEMPWEKDTEIEHLGRIIRWCKQNQLDCISVPLSHSAKNPSPLHIEMVVIPALQPTYLTEPTRAFGGKRLKTVPASLGYTPREEPYTAAPHPFS